MYRYLTKIEKGVKGKINTAEMKMSTSTPQGDLFDSTEARVAYNVSWLDSTSMSLSISSSSPSVDYSSI